MYQLHQTLVSIIKLTRLVFGNLIKIEYFKQVVIYHKNGQYSVTTNIVEQFIENDITNF